MLFLYSDLSIPVLILSSGSVNKRLEFHMLRLFATLGLPKYK